MSDQRTAITDNLGGHSDGYCTVHQFEWPGSVIACDGHRADGQACRWVGHRSSAPDIVAEAREAWRGYLDHGETDHLVTLVLPLAGEIVRLRAALDIGSSPTPPGVRP